MRRSPTSAGRVFVAAFLAATCYVLLFGFPSAVASSSDAPATAGASAPRGVPSDAIPVPESWTRNSRTYTADGSNVTAFYPMAVNYKDAQGAWQPIDNTLVGSNGGFTNKANSFQANLPASGAAMKKVSFPGGSLSFQLVGAKGNASAKGAAASYANAFAATTVTDTLAGDQLHETLTLSGLSAPKSFTYTLNPDNGLTAKATADGGVDVLDSSGKTVAHVVAPTMRDAAGASSPVATALTPTASGYSLTLNPDRSWLSSSARRWPVTIDPDIAPGSSNGGSTGVGSTECYMQSASPSTSFCPGDTDVVGWDGTNASRLLLDFGVTSNGLPSNAVVLDATLSMYVTGESTTNAAPLSVYNATKHYQFSPDWNQYDTLGGYNWATPGGDIDTGTVATQTVGGTLNTLYTWNVTQLVQSQGGGTDAGGFIVKQQNENVNNVLQIAGSSNLSVPSSDTPTLNVWWNNAIGQRSIWRYFNLALNDRMGVSVNLASGNLMVSAGDMNLQGTGLDLSTGHVYNSLNPGAGGSWVFGPIGGVNRNALGDYLAVTQRADGTIIYTGQSGESVAFAKNSDGSYANPLGFDASLAATSGTLIQCSSGAYSYVMTYHGDASKEYFDSSGYLVAEADSHGNAICYHYDTSHNLTSITDTQGRTTTVARTSTTMTVTDPASRTYVYTWNTSSQLTSYKDAAGNTTTYTYDTNGNLNKITDAAGEVTQFTYNRSAYLVGTGYRVATITRNCTCGNQAWTFTYNTMDDQSTAPYYVKVTDPLNHASTYYYDGQDRVTKATDPNGNSNQLAYDANGDVTSATDAYNKSTIYSYSGDSLHNLQSVQSPTGATESFTYADTSHPYYATKHTDAQGGAWSYTYDPNSGDLTQKDEAGQNPVKFTYNTNGTVATATDAKGTVTSYGYDIHGNLTSVTEPSPLHSESLTYDSVARVATATDGDGNTQTYTYDNLDRVTKIAYQDGSSVTYTYDKDGNLTQEVDSTGTTAFTYDGLNRLTQETLPGSVIQKYAYDAASRLTQYTDSGNNITKYGYDSANRLTSLTEPNNSVTSYTYNNDNNRLTTSYPNGVVETSGYDDSQRLTSVGAAKSGTQLTSFTYSYLNGSADSSLRRSVTAMVSGLYASETTSYGYDGLGRLTSASSPSTNYQYAYDVNGNMCAKNTGTTISGFACNSTGTGVTIYGYNTANELTSINGTGTFTYDGNGNLTGSPSYSALAYNTKNQTTSITPTGGSALTLGYSGPTQAVRVTADGVTQINSSMLGLTADKTASATTYYTREAGGALSEERLPSGNYYYLHDGLGSIVAITDSTGAIADSYKYDPYGNSVSSSGSVANAFRYAGYYLDTATGLYKVGLRYYDPSVGRWTQRDAVDDPLDEHGWNRYVYAADSPCNETDPTGARHWPYGSQTCASRTVSAYSLSATVRWCWRGRFLTTVTVVSIRQGRRFGYFRAGTTSRQHTGSSSSSVHLKGIWHVLIGNPQAALPNQDGGIQTPWLPDWFFSYINLTVRAGGGSSAASDVG